MKKIKFFFSYLNHRKGVIGAFLFFGVIFLVVFKLYQIPSGAVLYPAMLCIFFAVLFMLFDFRRVYRKHRILVDMQKLTSDLMVDFPEVETIDDEDYQQLIQLVRKEQNIRNTELTVKYEEMIDYYTVWAHQIKTPIAAISLNLQNDDSELAHLVSEELFRIEQYVEMVLVFLRLDSDYSDYVIAEYDLDSIIKGAVKKFAGQFIRRKIKLNYEPTDERVLTDEKWLSFVIEQVLSNALKYTPAGTVTIDTEPNKTLCIRDTGIGIAAEDLPRIFEKGYTGYNGRADKKASGIGLYLCKRICNDLGYSITANSSPDSGTVIRIGLEKEKIEIE
ncbi:MAG: sensor histidine kinase [Faecalibacterium sp.]|nr:sensor histidine kinase [Ruminococcus sp.]MCM1392955.1 sensor histidine kinase [Ruminococcus sp.]MCM1485308.1 sensor histidine kinase [Faecalibacterium sp.]